MGNSMVQMKVCNLEAVPDGSMQQFYVGDLEVLVVNFNSSFYALTRGVLTLGRRWRKAR
jgi:hypothetical protein